MAIKVRKRKNESDGAVISRFTRRVMRSGLIKETKGRRYFKRASSNLNKKRSALYILKKGVEYEKKRRWGIPMI